MVTIDANACPISLFLFKEALKAVGDDNVQAIRISPVVMQFYEEQGHARQEAMEAGTPISYQWGSQGGITVCGKRVIEIVRHTQNSVDLLGDNEEIVAQIVNLPTIMDTDPITGRLRALVYQDKGGE